MSDNSQAEYIKTAEAARRLRVSPKTVSRWAQEGKLPHLLTLGGHRRYKADDIDRLVKRLSSNLRVDD